ncbi:hypothetical protein RUM44_009089 [Polyplax serrata]|uniref:Uncharacterized protein n=1 Tax=Polyplax serrata TaxID=468196 RepID=A0ABR1ARX5_POLSC
MGMLAGEEKKTDETRHRCEGHFSGGHIMKGTRMDHSESNENYKTLQQLPRNEAEVTADHLGRIFVNHKTPGEGCRGGRGGRGGGR